MDEMDAVLRLAMLASVGVCVDDTTISIPYWLAFGFDQCDARQAVCLVILKLGGDGIFGSTQRRQHSPRLRRRNCGSGRIDLHDAGLSMPDGAENHPCLYTCSGGLGDRGFPPIYGRESGLSGTNINNYRRRWF